MRTTLCDPPVTHQSCDILAGESSWPSLPCWRSREALGRSRYCRECPASLTAAFWTGRAGQGWIPEQRLVPLAWPHGDPWRIQWTTAESLKDLQERPSPLALGLLHAFCSLPFYFGWNMSLAWVLHVLLLVKSPQICRKPHIGLSWSYESCSLPWILYDIW